MKILSLHLTDLCNSKCSFCVVGSPLYTREGIEYSQVVDFLTINANRGYDVVNIHGGEPTISPRFLETLDLINKLGYREIHLQTNGITLADPCFVDELILRRVTKFIISLHGATAKMHDSLTNSKNGFDATIKGISNVKKFGAHVRTNTVVLSENVCELPQIVVFLDQLFVDHINISNLHPTGSAFFGIQQLSPRFSVVRQYLHDAVEIAVKAGRKITLEGFPVCTIGEYRDLQITSEQRDIKMLMRGITIKNYDDFMNETQKIFGPVCVSCPVRKECGGVYKEYTDNFGWNEFSPHSLA